MEEKVFFWTSHGDKPCGMLSGPRENNFSVALLAHGHSSDKNTENFIKISELLNGDGLSTFRIDLYGHGESSGNFEDAVKNDGFKAVEKITIPTLIVHGDQDADVPLSQSKSLVKKLRYGRLEVIEGADHRYTNPEHAVKMRELLSDFMSKHLN